jgi:hypothetical protein
MGKQSNRNKMATVALFWNIRDIINSTFYCVPGYLSLHYINGYLGRLHPREADYLPPCSDVLRMFSVLLVCSLYGFITCSLGAETSLNLTNYMLYFESGAKKVRTLLIR